MKYNLNGKQFKTKKEITEHFRNILKRNDNQTLNENDIDYVLDLLKYHKKYEEKIGSGISHVRVEYHIDNLYDRPATHPHFELYRTDGTNIDFSFYKTISWIKNQNTLNNQHPKDVKRAMRHIVKDQIKTFRDKLFQKKRYHKCPILNINYSTVTAHIDHESPLTFDVMIHNFLTEKKLKFNDIQLIEITGIYSTFKNNELRKEWYKYHRDNAILRGTHKAGNMSQSRVSLDWTKLNQNKEVE